MYMWSAPGTSEDGLPESPPGALTDGMCRVVNIDNPSKVACHDSSRISGNLTQVDQQGQYLRVVNHRTVQGYQAAAY